MGRKTFPAQEYPGMEQCLEQAGQVMESIAKYSSTQDTSAVFQDANHLRWFLLPADVVGLVNSGRLPPASAPFVPGTLSAESSTYHLEKLKSILMFCKSQNTILNESSSVRSKSSYNNLLSSISRTRTPLHSYPKGWTSVLIYSISLLNSLISWPLDMILKGLIHMTQDSVTNNVSDSSCNDLDRTLPSINKRTDSTVINIVPESPLSSDLKRGSNEVDYSSVSVDETSQPVECTLTKTNSTVIG